jgi:hypothetical protein|tara:strand:+ start:314 stop:454 length:141 start_codon:yes stop_codon:yes gene_type:complete
VSEYTHNDDLADLLYAKDQEIAELQKKLEYVRSMLNQLEKDYARGL